MSLESRNNGDLLALIAFHAADLNLGGSFSLEVAALDEGGLGLFFCSVFRCTFPCGERESREVCGERFCEVYRFGILTVEFFFMVSSVKFRGSSLALTLGSDIANHRHFVGGQKALSGVTCRLQ